MRRFDLHALVCDGLGERTVCFGAVRSSQIPIPGNRMASPYNTVWRQPIKRVLHVQEALPGSLNNPTVRQVRGDHNQWVAE